MFRKSKKRIIVIIALIFATISCNSVQKKRKNKDHQEYIDFLISRNYTIKEKHFKEFYEFKKEENRQLLLNNKNLKTNKVYIYQGNKIIYIYVYADNGQVYTARLSKEELVEEPESETLKLDKSIIANSLGIFELKDNIIKNTRYRKIGLKEYYNCDVGILKKDTIQLIGNYRTNKFGSYKKKWLAKTYKINDNLIYKPDLKATKDKNQFGFDCYFIEGSFKKEKNVTEEKMQELFDNIKY